MKVSKPLLKKIALALVVSTSISACSATKETVKPDKKDKSGTETPKHIDNCPTCGMG